jgi:DNA-binding transcriptional MerR regulator
MAIVTYRIKDVALRLGRHPLTIKRWEELGYIRKARKDSRGWRIYSEKELKELMDLVRATDYFRDRKNYRNHRN